MFWIFFYANINIVFTRNIFKIVQNTHWLTKKYCCCIYKVSKKLSFYTNCTFCWRRCFATHSSNYVTPLFRILIAWGFLNICLQLVHLLPLNVWYAKVVCCVLSILFTNLFHSNCAVLWKSTNFIHVLAFEQN